MKYLLLVTFLIFGVVPAIPQAVDGALQITQVRDAIQQISSGSKPRVKITLRNLMRLEGTISRSNNESFSIKSKKGGNRFYYVPYQEVLELEGKDVSLSYFPDPKQTPFGEWEMVRRLKHGDRVQLYLEKGKKAEGVVFDTTGTELKLLRGNKTINFSREQILKIFYLRNNSAQNNQSVFHGVYNVDLISAIIILSGESTVRAVQKIRNDNRVLVFAK